MTVLPWNIGRPVTKSMNTCNQGQKGMGSGQRKPCGWVHGSMLWAQVRQVAAKALMSLSMLGHQNYPFRNFQGLNRLGVYSKGNVWPQVNVVRHRSCPRGHPPGFSSCQSVSRSHYSRVSIRLQFWDNHGPLQTLKSGIHQEQGIPVPMWGFRPG